MRHVIFISSILLLIFSSIKAQENKPNFIIIFTDDQGYGDLSCFGGDHVFTPLNLLYGDLELNRFTSKDKVNKI